MRTVDGNKVQSVGAMKIRPVVRRICTGRRTIDGDKVQSICAMEIRSNRSLYRYGGSVGGNKVQSLRWNESRVGSMEIRSSRFVRWTNVTATVVQGYKGSYAG